MSWPGRHAGRSDFRELNAYWIHRSVIVDVRCLCPVPWFVDVFSCHVCFIWVDEELANGRRAIGPSLAMGRGTRVTRVVR